MPVDRPLLMTIEHFLRERGMAATRFGRDAVRDPRFVLDLRRGREPGARTRNRVEHFVNNHRMVGAAKGVAQRQVAVCAANKWGSGTSWDYPASDRDETGTKPGLFRDGGGMKPGWKRDGNYWPLRSVQRRYNAI